MVVADAKSRNNERLAPCWHTIRTLFWRGIFWVSSATFIGGSLLALLALYQACGLATLWLAVGLLFVLHLALQRRGASYYDPGGAFTGSGSLLPAPGKRTLRGPGPPQIGRSRRPALPGPKK
jgi:hypothetical protein